MLGRAVEGERYVLSGFCLRRRMFDLIVLLVLVSDLCDPLEVAIELELSLGQIGKAKALLYCAVGECPWVKGMTHSHSGHSHKCLRYSIAPLLAFISLPYAVGTSAST